MLFNSFSFLLFLPIVFIGHWFLFSRNKTSQNLFLMLASYYFYASWDWRFLFLLVFSTLLDYASGIAIDGAATEGRKKLWLRLSLFINLGLLCYFKYCNFFIDSFVDLLHSAGIQANKHFINIVLPVGISFYTFHGVSYVFDIYNNKIKPHRNFVDYTLFVSYFPLLVAGPIERATHLLPQLKEKRDFNKPLAIAGLRLLLWGMVKKVVIADSLSPVVNSMFANYRTFSGASLLLGAIAFSIQIYCDFSGYTDIARGVSRLFGIELIKNFNFPYFSKNIAEFWGRWHISLSSWFRDYLYIPLGGSRVSKQRAFVNTMIIFLVSGFWHGAGWTFIVWGGLHGVYYLPILFAKHKKSSADRTLNQLSWSDSGKVLATFSVVCLAFIFFRAPSMSVAIGYIGHMFTDLIRHPQQIITKPQGIKTLLYIIPLIIADLMLYKGYKTIFLRYPALEVAATWAMIFLIFLSFQQETTFIYFQF